MKVKRVWGVDRKWTSSPHNRMKFGRVTWEEEMNEEERRRDEGGAYEDELFCTMSCEK